MFLTRLPRSYYSFQPAETTAETSTEKPADTVDVEAEKVAEEGAAAEPSSSVESTSALPNCDAPVTIHSAAAEAVPEPEIVAKAPAHEAAQAQPPTAEPRPAEASPKKKKKKKTGYAAMMAGVMAPTLSEEEKLKATDAKMRAGMGGGEFSKLHKI